MEYLPASIAWPLSRLLAMDISLSNALPLAISLLSLYFAFLALYSSLRYSLRLAIFIIKYGTLFAVLAASYAVYTDTIKLNDLVSGGSSAWSLAKWGYNFYQGGEKPTPTRSNIKRGYSASGIKKKWDTLDQDGGWEMEEPAQTPDHLKAVQDALLSYLAPPPEVKYEATPGKGTKSKKHKRKGTSEKVHTPTLAEVTLNFALGKARRAWDDLIGSSSTS